MSAGFLRLLDRGAGLAGCKTQHILVRRFALQRVLVNLHGAGDKGQSGQREQLPPAR